MRASDLGFRRFVAGQSTPGAVILGDSSVGHARRRTYRAAVAVIPTRFLSRIAKVARFSSPCRIGSAWQSRLMRHERSQNVSSGHPPMGLRAGQSPR